MNKLLLAACLLLLLASCSKSGNDNSSPTPSLSATNQLLVGTWKETSLTEVVPAAAGAPEGVGSVNGIGARSFDI